MSAITPIRRLGNSFTNRRGPSVKSATLTRIQRRARDLMSLASMAGFCAVVWWLMIGGMVWTVTASSSDPSSAQKVLEHWNLMPTQLANGWILALVWSLALVAMMAPIVCLRRLGKALYSQTPLSPTVARSFQWLGHALIANIFLGWIAAAIAASQIKAYQVTFSLGFLGTFIAAILAYVVAEMVREGALAAEENRGFV